MAFVSIQIFIENQQEGIEYVMRFMIGLILTFFFVFYCCSHCSFIVVRIAFVV